MHFLHPRGFLFFLDSSHVLPCSVICVHMREQQWIAVCVLDKWWHPLGHNSDPSFQKAACLSWHPVRPADGHFSAPKQSPPHELLLIPFALCAADIISPCTSCSRMSTAIKISYLFLIVMLEDGNWNRILLMWITGVHGASFSEMFTQGHDSEATYLHLSSSCAGPGRSPCSPGISQPQETPLSTKICLSAASWARSGAFLILHHSAIHLNNCIWYESWMYCCETSNS